MLSQSTVLLYSLFCACFLVSAAVIGALGFGIMLITYLISGKRERDFEES